MNRLIPLNLQFFADGGEDEGAAKQEAAEKPDNKEPSGTNPSPMTPEALAKAFTDALSVRQTRAERSVAKSFAEQYGLSESEVTGLLEKAQAEKARQLPPEVQKQIDDANRKAQGLLIAAEVKSAGAEMGLIDPDAALMMIDRTRVKVDADGKVTGVKEALEALKGSKGYLFGQQAAWGQKQSGTAAEDDDMARMRRAMGLPPEKK